MSDRPINGGSTPQAKKPVQAKSPATSKSGSQAKQVAPSKGVADPLQLAKLRADFYTDSLLLTKRLAIVSIVVFILSSLLLMYSIAKQEKASYIAVGADGTILKLVALSEPNQKDSAVSDWVSKALVDTFDFSYFNMRTHLTDATMRWFTDNGRNEFLNALKKTGNFDVIENSKLIVGLTVDHTPLVAKKGVAKFNGAYNWKLEVPATITYRTETDVYSNKVLFTITVSRRSVLEDKQGLGIERITMEIIGKNK